MINISRMCWRTLTTTFDCAIIVNLTRAQNAQFSHAETFNMDRSSPENLCRPLITAMSCPAGSARLNSNGVTRRIFLPLAVTRVQPTSTVDFIPLSLITVRSVQIILRPPDNTNVRFDIKR